jgi:hypothetical protein
VISSSFLFTGNHYIPQNNSNSVDPQSYHIVKEAQALNGEFKDYPGIIIKAINKCEKPDQYFFQILLTKYLEM